MSFPVDQAGWHRRVLSLALPVMLAGMTVPLVGAVDTAVVGRLENEIPLAAVAVGATIFSTVFWVFGFLRMGTTGFIAQAHGRGDRQEASVAFGRALLTALVLGFALIALQGPVGSLALRLMGAPAEVTRQAAEYFSLRVLSAPFTFINYCVLGALIGQQRTNAVLLLQVGLNLCNLLLDLLFVPGLGMQVRGVALASLCSEVLTALAGLYFLRHILPLQILRSAPGRRQLFDRLAWRRLFSVNGDLFVRTFLLTGGFFFFTSQSADFGAGVLAANAILINMLMMLSYGLDGYAHAAEALTGAAWGGGRVSVFRRAVRYTTFWSLMTAVLACVLYAFAGEGIIALMTTLPGVRAQAAVYLPWVVFSPLVAVWCYQLDGIFLGATRTAAMRNSAFLSLLGLVLSAWWLMPLLGNHGLWAAMMVFHLLRGGLLGLAYPGLLRALRGRVRQSAVA
ncbi:MATE family efflux transporter [Granulosicoccaceae sp. 1_MG-2023]|nr:MATE family efflux transporter [Granulosicoccaceae sp. 1_MG-2023]